MGFDDIARKVLAEKAKLDAEKAAAEAAAAAATEETSEEDATGTSTTGTGARRTRRQLDEAPESHLPGRRLRKQRMVITQTEGLTAEEKAERARIS